MLAVPAPPLERSLDDFYGDSAARVDEFIAVWSRDLPRDLSEINEQIGFVFQKKGRTRFSVWFKMVYTDVDQIVLENGGDDGWRSTVEDLTGFKFALPKAPGQKELVPSVGQKQRKAEAETKADDLCVSARLSMAGSIYDERLPDSCYSVVQTEAPHEMAERELSAFTDEVLQHIACTFGDWKLGMTLARQYGKEAEKRLPPLPTYGDKSRKGKLGKIIWQKCKNRLYHADTYKKPLVVNTVDLTEEATIHFKSKLQNLVDLDEMPKEHKYQKHSSPASPQAPDTPAPPFVPAPAASGTQEGGIVLFGSAHPLPPQTTTTPAANEGAAPAPQPEEPSNSGNGGSAAATAGSAGATGHPPSETAGATVPPSKPKKRKKPENKENQADNLAPIEVKRAETISANKAKLVSLGLEDKADLEASKKRKAEEAKAKQAARKQARIEQNWTSLCRVGTRVKVPGQTFESAVSPVVPPECGYWEGKVTQCVDNYANFWIKCPREAPFYRPVDEVLKWEFIDPPKPLPASAPPTEETPAVETAAVETPAVDVQAPAVETPAAHVLHTVEPLSESEMQRVDQYYQFINQPLDQFIDRPLVQPPPQQHDYHTRSTPAATAVPPPPPKRRPPPKSPAVDVQAPTVETPAVDAQAPAAEVVIIEGVAVSAHVSRAAAILAP